MARILGAFPAALIAARNGLSGAEFIRYLRAAGEGARESEVRALLKLAYSTISKSQDEAFADPNLVPDLSTAKPWPTAGATGVSQAIELTYRDKSTGTLITVPYQVHSANGVTRAEAIAKAIEAYSANAERYKQDLVGAIHTKTFVLTPGWTASE
jgi:hypothetical protein